MSEKLKLSGFLALTGGALACLLTPVMSLGYYQAYAVPGETPPFWFSAAQTPLSFLFAFADEKTAYASYGKLFAIVYLLFLPGVWALHKLQRKAGSRLEKTGYYFLLTALVVSCAGVTLDYWEIKPGWSLELLGMLLLQIAATLYGIASLSLKIIPRRLSILFAAALPLCIASFMLFKQIPGAPTLPFAVVSIAAGVFIIRLSETKSDLFLPKPSEII
ncbi:MAG TPA: hypothetical protein VK400_02730 [Pyrinomonadaceae bacterium]|nr:hypothetical protein [Pyrinomonadaceae bacterium]